MQQSNFRFVSLAMIALFTAALATPLVRAEVKVVVDHNDEATATPAFAFANVASPAEDDAASTATFSLVEGTMDRSGADLVALRDGKLPDEADDPESCFFFSAGTRGGRLAIDLRRPIDIAAVNTYSWHTDARGPQVYKLYASDASAAPIAKGDADPIAAGWKLIASIDTRPKPGEPSGGQYAVSICDAAGVNGGGSIGRFRHLLLDISRTEDADNYGNTFFAEIDVIERGSPASTRPAAGRAAAPAPVEIRGVYVTLDLTAAPDLKDWAETTLLPVCDQWYPSIVKMLPSDGFTAADRFTIQFRATMRGGIPAATAGTRVMCNAPWFRRNLRGEALGAVVHEMVHVVQQYGQARRTNPHPAPNPGWLVEGIADYIRWFKYEPQSRGAEIRDPSKANFDASYRVTANFLNFVTETHDKEIVAKLNAAMRAGNYSDDLWKQYTGRTAAELNEQWKQSLSHESR